MNYRIYFYRRLCPILSKKNSSMENTWNTVKPARLISQITRRNIPWYGSAKSVKYRHKSTCVPTYNTHTYYICLNDQCMCDVTFQYISFFLILRITVLSTLITTLQAVTCVILRSYIIFYYQFLYTYMMYNIISDYCFATLNVCEWAQWANMCN